MCSRIRLLLSISVLVVTPLLWARPAWGTLVLFDDEQEFMDALVDIQLEIDEFEDLLEGYYSNPIRRWVSNPEAYSIGSTSIVGLNVEFDQVTTVLPKSMISLQAEPGPFRAIGATFGITDINGNPISGEMRILLQDGESYIWDVMGGTTFVGVIGLDEPVTSLTVGAAANAPLVNISTVIISDIPSPAAWALLFLPMAMSFPRTRRP